jgi:uncharacterized protein YjbI with pentapeptide repeats
MRMDSSNKQQTWDWLISGQLALVKSVPRSDGRIDLRQIASTDPNHVGSEDSRLGRFAILQGLTEFRNVRWDGIDFTGSRLNSLRFFDSEVTNCVFDKCSCRDLRLWRTSFKKCFFRATDLRGSSLGAVLEGRRNSFEDLIFERADLRDISFNSAEFTRCSFKDSKLKKIDFRGSIFVDCVFEGKLEEVIFSDRRIDAAKDLSPNLMTRVDFSNAELRWVEFRRLDLAGVKFPTSDEYIVLDDFPRFLDLAISSLAGKNDDASTRLSANLVFKKK